MTLDQTGIAAPSIEQKGESKSTEGIHKRRVANSWAALTVVLAGITLASFAAWAYLGFGSIGLAIGYLAGERLMLDGRNKSFGELSPGKKCSIVFHVTNRADRAITLLGAETFCTCLLVENLPRRLRVGETYSLQFELRAGSSSGEISQQIRLYTDYSMQSTIHLSIRGRVLDPKPSTPTGAERGSAPTGAFSLEHDTDTFGVHCLFFQDVLAQTPVALLIGLRPSPQQSTSSVVIEPLPIGLTFQRGLETLAEPC